MTSERKTYVIGQEDVGTRLDQVLTRSLCLSRTRVQHLIEQGHIRLNGKAVQAKDKLAVGEEVEVCLPPVVTMTLIPESHQLDILFEDEHLLALNKAAGIVVHPSAGHDSGTLVHALLHHCAGHLSGIGGVARPGIVHRLDKETSGVLLVAKTDSAHQRLVEQFKSREVKKWYLAYLHGHPSRPAGEWNGPIGRHRIHRQKMTVLPTGKSALSRFRVLQPGNLASLVEVEIRTGRTHQIRVHASHAGHPVVGDHIYGRKRNWESEAEVSRHLLHAARLEVAHPITGEILKIEATPPEEFGKFANWLAQRSD